jgi:3,4-dihydroxy 2-butanone 4-phosphate synthase/GTP cyclohydrolase II
MIIIVDDEDRENEGDLGVRGRKDHTRRLSTFMARHARGLICLPLTEERCDELHLPPQVADNTSKLGTAFTVSIEARRGVTTGISAADRATTILTAVDQRTKPQDPGPAGHVFSVAREKRRRAGATRTDGSGRRHRRASPDFIRPASSAKS